MIHGSASPSPNPDFVPLAYAVGCEDCERIKDFIPATRTVPLGRSQYRGGGLVCQECEEERTHVEALVNIGELVSRLRGLGWEDVAELVIRRKLSPADRLFRTLDQLVVDELAAQHPRSRENSDSIAVRPGISSLPRNPGSPVEGLRTRWSSVPRPR